MCRGDPANLVRSLELAISSSSSSGDGDGSGSSSRAEGHVIVSAAAPPLPAPPVGSPPVPSSGAMPPAETTVARGLSLTLGGGGGGGSPTGGTM